jgi:hypothetical protein
MSFAPKEIIVGASVPLENGGSVTFSIAGHIEAERDIDDAVVIFGRKLLKFTNCATDEDRLTVRQIISSITSTPLDKVSDVGTPTSIPSPVEPAKTSPSVTLDQVSPLPERMPLPLWQSRQPPPLHRSSNRPLQHLNRRPLTRTTS